MNGALLLLARYIRDTMDGFDQDNILFGRENEERADFEQEIIVIDTLAASNLISTLESYDPEAEEESIGTVVSTPCIVDFYGENAYSNAMLFSAMNRSQKGKNAAKTHGLNVFNVNQFTDVAKLTGQQYSPRIQIALNVQHCEEVALELLRIDEAQFYIINEVGELTHDES